MVCDAQQLVLLKKQMGQKENENKELLKQAFLQLENGKGDLLRELMAEDFWWEVKGSTSWSQKFEGKTDVINNLLRPLVMNFKTQYSNTASRFFADGDYVIVECRGNVKTINEADYNNEYCWICEFRSGKLISLTEYGDTALIEKVLPVYVKP
jgi:ketosteroid isomerase-like protein